MVISGMLKLVLFVAVVGASACLGDLSHEAWIENAADRELTVYLLGRAYPAHKVVLEPGETHRDNYLYSEPRDRSFIAQIEATDAEGQLFYCRRYAYPDMEKIGWRVRITGRDIAC